MNKHPPRVYALHISVFTPETQGMYKGKKCQETSSVSCSGKPKAHTMVDFISKLFTPKISNILSPSVIPL